METCIGNYNDRKTRMSVKEIKGNLIRIIKYVRAAYSLTQTDLANILGCSRYKVTRIENNKGAISIFELTNFMDYFKLGYECLKTGVWNFDEKVQDLERFNINPAYRENAYTSGRVLQVHLNYFRNVIGDRPLVDFCKEEKVNHTYFTNINNTLNVNFSLRLIQKYLMAGISRSDDELKRWAKMAHALPAHNFKMEELYKNVHGVAKIVKFMGSSTKYEMDHDFKMESYDKKNREIVFSFAPREYVNEDFYYNDPFVKGIFGQLIKNYLQELVGDNVEFSELKSCGRNKTIYRFKDIPTAGRATK